MKLSVSGYTNQGGREHNEDSIRYSVENGRGVFALADGLGGHQCGEVASAAAAEYLLDGCKSIEKLNPEAVADLFAGANRQVLKAQEIPGQEEMKTTAVLLAAEDNTAVWGHVGDSRLYWFSEGHLRSVTKDHSVTYMKYLGGEISYMDVYHDDDRSSLLRVMGKQSCQPDIRQETICPGDAFLLCSDGFWEFVYNEEIEADLLKAETPGQWIQLMLLRHIRRTPPGNDNFSVIAVFAEESL